MPCVTTADKTETYYKGSSQCAYAAITSCS